MVFISDLLSWVSATLLEPSVMQTGHLILMTEDQHQVQQSTLALISYLGGPASSRLLPSPAQKQNIEA